MPRQKGGKQAFKHSIVDEPFEKQEEEGLRVRSLSKEFLALVDAFFVFVIQQVEAIT
jgi:hypothetical protein